MLAVASAAVVGVATGVLLHNVFGSSRRSPVPRCRRSTARRRGGVARSRRRSSGSVTSAGGPCGSPRSAAGPSCSRSWIRSARPSARSRRRSSRAAMRPLPGGRAPRLVVVSVDLADTPRSVAKAARKWHLPAGFEWLLGTHAAARAGLARLRHRRPPDEGRRRRAQRRVLRHRPKRRRACRLPLAVHSRAADARPAPARAPRPTAGSARRRGSRSAAGSRAGRAGRPSAGRSSRTGCRRS